MDWVKWHEGYESSPSLVARLEIVRAHIASCLDNCGPRPIQVLSVCAGDGRDLLWALRNHPRVQDVKAWLVEANPDLVQRGEAAVRAAGLERQVEFRLADATQSSIYTGIAPADLVLLCGVFGNVHEREAPRLVECLSYLCWTGGFVVWTRIYEGDGAHQIALIRELLNGSGFEEVCFDITPDGTYGIGTHRHLGEIRLLPRGQRLFEFPHPLSAGGSIQRKFLKRKKAF